LAILPACGGRDNGGTPIAVTTAPPANPGEVVIANLAFSPAVIHVAVGQTVTWRFADGVPHTVTSDATSPQRFASSELVSGTFPVKFPAAGTFSYHCTVHAKMHGTVVVP
jgi:plastocyanin